MRKVFKLVRFCALSLILGMIFSETVNAQCSLPGITEDVETLNTVYDNFKVYPSMAPRAYIKVSYDNFVRPEFFESNQADDLANFFIVKDGEDCAKRLKIEKLETFKGINYLIFDAKSNGLKKGDNLNVGILVERRDPSGTVVGKFLKWDSIDDSSRRKIPVPEISTYTLNATPNVVPDQELIDGKKRTVGQLKLSLDVPSLVTNNNVARLYFKTDNLISTNWKDKNSRLETRFGAERSLTDKWYMPIHFEVKGHGDQRLKNATFVTSSGIKTIIPWAWTKKGLFNQIIRAPVSPEFGLSGEYHRRIKQDAASLAKFPRKDAFALAGQFTWLPIQLFTRSCEKTDANGNIREDFDKCYSAQNISLELSAKGWWFPYEKTLTGTKVRKFEGRGEISLLIPVKNLADQFLFQQKGNEPINATSRVRVKYVVGANDANGFKRASQLTFGIELIK